jgi:hypothetical protein
MPSCEKEAFATIYGCAATLFPEGKNYYDCHRLTLEQEAYNRDGQGPIPPLPLVRVSLPLGKTVGIKRAGNLAHFYLVLRIIN